MLQRRLAIAAIAGFAFSSPVAAQSGITWENGQPIFHSSPQYRGTYQPPRYNSYGGYGGYYDDYYYDEAPPKRRPSNEVRSGGARPHIAAKAPQTISFVSDEETGTVIIDTKARKLYYVLSSTAAYAYPISVGREGFSWTGTEQVSRIAAWPDWHPPADMRKRQPELPKKMLGGLRNPLGAKAIYLGNTLYRIHGTNDAKSIGRAASSGCFRMMNSHVMHLATLVGVGTTVKVVKHWPPTGKGVVAVDNPAGPS